tara:strand:+ start:482 stop:631 length:150 start_codon:yes stop_codon:yes gene_type:complete
MSSWIKSGQMKYHETIYEGIEKAADEFGLLDVSKFSKKLPGEPPSGHGI